MVFTSGKTNRVWHKEEIIFNETGRLRSKVENNPCASPSSSTSKNTSAWLAEHGIVFFWMSGFFFLLSRFVWKEKEKLIQKKTHVRQQPMFFSFVTRSFVFILPSRWSGSRIPANQREERKTNDPSGTKEKRTDRLTPQN